MTSPLLILLRAQTANAAFELTDISSAAHNWHADTGLSLTGSLIDSWTDEIGSQSLSMSGTNRPSLETTGDYNVINMIPDPTIKLLTIDGGITNHPPLAALNKLTGYIAISFQTTIASTGGLLGLADNATVLPYWTNGVMYLPDDTDILLNIGASPVTLNTWGVITLNYRADGTIVRYNGVEISTDIAKNYNFSHFVLNRRMAAGSGSGGGYNKVRQLFIASDGITDADNLAVEALFAADLTNAPT